MAVPPEILELIARFEQQIDSYKSGDYNETQLRREFLDPFFKALGWDIDNTQGYAEAYKDVVHEDAIRIGDSHKAPDYCFRIGGSRKFFLEAKKPSVSIKDEVTPAYQLRSYGWSAKGEGRGENSPIELAHCAPEPPDVRLSPSPLRSGGEGWGEEALRAQGETSFDVRRSMFDVRCSRVHGVRSLNYCPPRAHTKPTF